MDHDSEKKQLMVCEDLEKETVHCGKEAFMALRR